MSRFHFEQIVNRFQFSHDSMRSLLPIFSSQRLEQVLKGGRVDTDPALKRIAQCQN